MTRTCAASVLFEELVALGFDRSYPTLVREIRELGLRPVCDCCKAGAVKVDGRAGARAGRGAAAGLARAVRDAVGREGVRAGRRAVALRPDAWRVRGRDDVRAPHRGARRRPAPPRRHRQVVADRPDGDGRLPGHRSAAAGGGGGGEALRRHGRGVSGEPAAAQGRRREGDRLRHAVVVARRASVDAGGGAGRPGPLVRRRLGPPPARHEHRRQSSRPQSRCSVCRSWRSRPSIRPSGSSPTTRWSRSSQTATASRPATLAQTVTVRARFGRDASGDLLAGRPADRAAPPRP